MTTVDKKQQGDIVLLNIMAAHKLKERLKQDIGEKVVNNKNGVNLILEALEAIYGDDHVLDCYL